MSSELIKNTFETYFHSIINDDGATAYSVIDKNTRGAYDQYIKLVLNAEEDEVRSLGLMDKFQVILIRHRLDGELLKTMTGQDLFIYAVDHGWVGKESASRLGLGDIEVEGEFAQAIAVSNGEVTKMKFDFYLEDNEWKFDIMKLTQYSEPALKMMQVSNDLSEEEFAFQMSEMVSGIPVDTDTIFNPITT